MSTYQRKLEAANGGRDVELPENMRSVLPLFLQAHDYAHGLGRDVWDFALELWQLSGSGLTRNDIRWLICKGYVEHSQEITARNEAARAFAACSKLRFTQYSCFVLTQQGVLLARRPFAYGVLGRDGELLNQYSRPPHDEPPTSSGRSDNSGVKILLEEGHHLQTRPTWNEVRRELKVNGILVKRFRVPAPNQQLVLVVFQESDWPEQIDDPLAQHDQQSKPEPEEPADPISRKRQWGWYLLAVQPIRNGFAQVETLSGNSSASANSLDRALGPERYGPGWASSQPTATKSARHSPRCPE